MFEIDMKLITNEIKTIVELEESFISLKSRNGIWITWYTFLTAGV